MSVATRLPYQDRLRRYVVAPLILFLCGLIVVTALTLGAGRGLLFFASEFTPQLNSMLASKRISLEGVQAQWRGINPVLQVQKVTFGAGQFQNLELELDSLESLIRNAWVPRHLYWQQAEVHFEQQPVGWRLRNQQRIVLPFDIVKSLRHGDRLFGAIELIFHPETGQSMGFSADIRAQNISNEHMLDMVLAANKPEATKLGVSWVERVSWSDEQVVARDVSVSGRLALPAGLFSSADMVITTGDSRWRQRQDVGQGRLAAQALLSATNMTAPMPTLRAGIDTEWITRGDAIHGTTRKVDLQSGVDRSNSIALDPLHFRIKFVADELWPELMAWSQGVDLAAITSVLQPSAGIWPIFDEWLTALAPSGKVHSLYGYVSNQGAIAYSASLSDVSAQGYRGAPSLRNAQGRFWGDSANIAMQLNADDINLQFPTLFARVWDFEYVQGLIKFHLQPGHMGLRGQNIKARRHGSALAVQFAVTRPKNPYEQRFSIQLGMDGADTSVLPDYISFKMAEGLQSWLRQAPQAGRLDGLFGAYHGQLRQRPGELARRLEIRSDLAQGRIIYEPSWPELQNVSANIHVAGPNTRVQVSSAEMAGARFAASQIALGTGARVADVQFDAQTGAAQLLDFLRDTPLRSSFAFVGNDWSANGNVRLQGSMRLPLTADAETPLALDLDFQPEQMSLSMPDYRLNLENAAGQGTFTLPHQLAGSFAGNIFGQQASIAVTSDAQQINFAVRGALTPDDIYTLAGLSDLGVLSGKSQFSADLSIDMRGGISALVVDTDLLGMAVNLPGELGKTENILSPSRFDLQFLDGYQSLQWRYQNTQGWVHLDDRVLRGSIGLSAVPAVIQADQDWVSIGGNLAAIDVEAWSQLAVGSGQYAVDWQMDNLRVGELVVGDLIFGDLRLAGRRRVGEFIFSVQADDLVGRVDLTDAERLGIDLDFLRLPAPNSVTADPEADLSNDVAGLSAADPLSIELGRSLPAAWVSVEELRIGDEDYGNWQFEIKPDQDSINFDALNADVRGVHLRNAQFIWDLSDNTTAYSGRVALDDLALTLPMWDFAPTMETESASLQVDLQWPGSPPNIELLGLHGSMNFKAKNGRFLDADTSANGLRLISLFTPSALAKRINKFDFSDIVDDGMSFDRLSATVSVGQEEMVFTDRMIVESPSSSFEFGGRVNLRSEMLDNEMIVTLPVSSSLPWYGAYLALANPVAGLSVMLGEQILRKPIQQFSSAKFAITGTLEEPQVKFVSLWDKSMKAAPQPGSLAPIGEPAQEAEAPPLEPAVTDSGGTQSIAEPLAETADPADVSPAAEIPAAITVAKKDKDEP